MMEDEWLSATDPEEMFFRVVRPLMKSQRRIDLFCLACAGLVLHLIEDIDAKQAFEWLEQHPGDRSRPKGGHVRELFHGPALGLYDAHHRRERGVSGRAVHVAYDFWADWYEYAFPNLCELHRAHPDALREEPRTCLSAILRDIFGNPFRPISISPSWQTANIRALARAIYDNRQLPSGLFDNHRLAVLADALEEAGCDNADILGHLRNGGEHVRGCWAIDALLGKE